MAQGPSPYASLRPSVRDLDFVAGEAGGNWRSLLTHLGITLSEIQRFFNKNSNNVRDACFEGLVFWLSSEVNDHDPEEPVTFGTLFQALREASMASCVSQLEEKLEARFSANNDSLLTVDSRMDDSNISTGSSAVEDIQRINFVKDALKNRSVKVKVVKSVFLGPPGVGKTQLKRALLGDFREVQESANVSTQAAPAVEVLLSDTTHKKWELFKASILQNFEMSTDKNSGSEKQWSSSADTYGQHPVTRRSPSVDSQVTSSSLFESSFKRFEKIDGDILKSITDAEAKSGSKEPLEFKLIYIIDNGGQPSFLDFHSVTATFAASYVHLFDARGKGLADFPEMAFRKTKFPIKDMPPSIYSNVDLLRRSLLTVHHFKSRFNQRHEKIRDLLGNSFQPAVSPHVLIVGTHKDSSEISVREADTTHLHSICESIPSLKHQYDIVFVDSLNQKCEELRDIRATLSQEDNLNQFDLPLSWFQVYLLSLSVANGSEASLQAQKYDDLYEMCLRQNHVQSPEEFRAMVTVMHSLGVFCAPELDQLDPKDDSSNVLIFLNPNLLFEYLSLIFVIPFCKLSLSSSHHLRTLQDRGELIPKCLGQLGIPDTLGTLPGFHNKLLGWLVNWHLAAKKDGEDKWFIPSVLPPRPKRAPPFVPGGYFENVFPLYLTFFEPEETTSNKCFHYFPAGLFPHLVLHLMMQTKRFLLYENSKSNDENGYPYRCRDSIRLSTRYGLKLKYTLDICLVDESDRLAVYMWPAYQPQPLSSDPSPSPELLDTLYHAGIVLADLKLYMTQTSGRLFCTSIGDVALCTACPCKHSPPQSSSQAVQPAPIHLAKVCCDDREACLQCLSHSGFGSSIYVVDDVSLAEVLRGFSGLAQVNRMALEKAIKKRGAVTLHITRCILIGPPRVGKSCFKHLLVHYKPCLVQESTLIMEAPVVLTSMWTQQGKEGAWKELTTVDLEKLVCKCAMDGKYNDGKIDDDNSTAKPLDEQPINEGHNSIAETTAVQSIAAELKPSLLKPATQTPNPLDSTDEHPQANPAPQQAGLNDKRNPVAPGKLTISDKLSNFLNLMSRDDIGVDLNNLKLIHVFDCGGQLVFQDTIPLLINAPCAFIAIFNAFEGLDKEIKLTYCLGGKELPTCHKDTQWNMLRSILSSIQSLQYKCHQDLKDLIKEPSAHSFPIAVVGTHKDKIVHSDIDRFKRSIETQLSDLNDSMPCEFIKRKGQILNLVGNLTPNDLDQIVPLREEISKNATFIVDLPLPWLILELFTRSRVTEQAFYRYSEFKELCDPLLLGEGDFNTCIQILHILGFYAFYPLRELSEDENWICTDAATLYKEVSKLLMVQHVDPGNNTTARFKETGRIPLKEEALKELFEDLKISIRVDRKWLMHVLLHLGLAAKIKMKRDSEEDSDSEAFIPLALPPGLSDIPSKTSVAPLCFTLDFTNEDTITVSANSTGIPRGTFSRLVVLLLCGEFPGYVGNKWEIWQKNSKEHCISKRSYISKRSCIKFRLTIMNSRCAVYLKESMGHIEASVVLFQTSLPRTGNDHNRILKGSSLCQDISKTLTAALKKAFEQVFGTRCQPKVVLGFACSECDSSNGYNHIAIIHEPSFSTDEFSSEEPTAVCSLFKEHDYFLTAPDQLIWFNPGLFIDNADFKFTCKTVDGDKLWILEESSTSDSSRTRKRGVGEGSHSEQSPSTTELPQARHSATDPSRAEQLHRQEYTQGPPAPRTGMDEKIARSLDILKVPEYRKGLIGEMRMLGSVLGIGEYTNAILKTNGGLDDHLVKILDHYIAVKIPTWQDFCKSLKGSDCFNNVRAKIEATDHTPVRALPNRPSQTTSTKHVTTPPETPRLWPRPLIEILIFLSILYVILYCVIQYLYALYL